MGERRPAGLLGVVVVAAIGLTAVNLRPAVTSVGPVLAEIRAGLAMSGLVAGLLTAFPALCFVVFGTFAPRLVRRFGPAGVLCVAAAAVALGLALRPYVGGGAAAFVAVSAVALGAIGIANVVMPVAVKQYFPHRIGTVTGFYSMMLAIGAATAAALTVPIATAVGGSQTDGWRAGLAAWAIPAVLATLAWLPLALRGRGGSTPTVPPATPSAVAGPLDPAGPTLTIRRSRTAWTLAVFFGLQSAGAYMVIGWLPTIFRDAGFSASTAGLLLAATPAVGVPLSFLLPAVAGRMRSQSGLAVGLSVLGLAAYAGLGFAPAAAPWLWVAMLGASQSTFPLVLTMIGLRARTADGVVRLSSFAQGVGYLLSFGAPILIGTLYEHSGGWAVPIAFMASLLVPQADAGWLAGRPRWVEDDVRPR